MSHARVGGGAASDEVHQRRIVDDGIGHRHHRERGDAAGRGGRTCRGQGLAVFGAGLAGEDAHVDKAGREDFAGAIDDLRVRGFCVVEEARADVDDLAVFDKQCAGAIEPRVRVDQARVDEGGARAHGRRSSFGSCRASASSTAMRIGNAHLDLLMDQAAVDVVGDGAVDLDAAVHRAWMHHERAGFGERQFLAVEAVEVEVLALRGQERAGHALHLQAQHHDDVGAFDALAHIGEDFGAPGCGARRHQGARCDQADMGAELGQQMHVRTRDAAVHDVAADRDRQAFDPLHAAADGERVEECLRRMFVRAVAGIDDRARHLVGQKRDGAGILMADDDDVGAHRVQRRRRVDQGFALAHRGLDHRHVHHVGAQALAGEFERGLRARRRLEEQVDQRAAAQRVALFLNLAC